MGVKGLWSLLNPVARPVQIESMEGKRLAIDSSIWLYQFQATMRDKDGRVLVNAHVLGFLRRINKLLFHGIKPVFVFDGGAPALKRSTIAERKRKKAGAAFNAAKVAEKLLQAQMRREALRVTQEAQAARAAREVEAAYDDDEGERIPENAVYLDQLEGAAPGVTRTSAPQPEPEEESQESKRRRFRKRDRYELPDATIPQFSTEAQPDARLATEEELRQFIDEVNPEDIDIESAEFRALPTEVQYEIIGDLRIRSRQQSGRRLAEMLSNAPTALDFSKAQIKHLSQRNALTQQLLTVTDMVSKAHLTIPVRVAAERNRQYLLVKRDDGSGWALGIRDGTKERPIVLEPETEADRVKKEQEEKTKYESGSEDDFSDASDIEEYKPPPNDDELRKDRRREVLEAIARRYAPVQMRPSMDVAVMPFGKTRAPGAIPLFDSGDDADRSPPTEPVVTANDEALALALQREELGADEDEADPELARALALSRQEQGVSPISSSEDEDEFEEVSLVPSASGTETPGPLDVTEQHGLISVDDSDEELVAVVPAPTASKRADPERTSQPAAATSQPAVATPQPDAATSQPAKTKAQHIVVADSSDEDELEEVFTPELNSRLASEPVGGGFALASPPPQSQPSRQRPNLAQLVQMSRPKVREPSSEPELELEELHKPDFERRERSVSPETGPSPLMDAPSSSSSPKEPSESRLGAPSPSPETPEVSRRRGVPSPALSPSPPLFPETDRVLKETQQNTLEPAPRTYDYDSDSDNDVIEWSRSPTPPPRPDAVTRAHSSVASVVSEPFEDEDEMAPVDMVAEEDDYARFLAQIKNRDLNEVRGEIDDEIRILNQQAKVAMRDSDDITQSMVVQIQTLLRHFGIPYITAPMEAEAQCAKLAELGLVDGIITDDSDVFLFGGTQCFKNIFNDAKFAECFLSSDIERELSLTRDRLVSLSYLLGSDYTLGLSGVGPVLALEVLANFPGPDGLQRFRDWWLRVQMGQDTEDETNSKWKKSFVGTVLRSALTDKKKRFADSIQLSPHWPDPHVREAYIYPTTDESDEPFHWGFPRLAALRTFLHEELSWSISKVDDELTPIVQRIAQRGKGNLKSQATLLPFFLPGNTAAGTDASYVPRRRTTANMSKRLMGVIKQFREAEAAAQGQTGGIEWGDMLAGVDENDPKGRGPMKRALRTTNRQQVNDDEEGDEELEEVDVPTTSTSRSASIGASSRRGKGKGKAPARAPRDTRKRGSKRKSSEQNDDDDYSDLPVPAQTRRRRTHQTASAEE